MTREQQITQTTIIGSVVNVLLTIGKLLAGFFGHSAAMLADGLHSLSDLVSDVIVLVCVRFSSKKRDTNHTYGHGKYETLATLCIALLLLLVGLELFWSGIQNIVAFTHGVILAAPEKMALWAALISILSKELLYHYTASVANRVNSPVVMTNAWHHRTDALSSVASAIGIGGAIFLGEKWTILDPVTCCFISIFILYIALKMATPALRQLLEVALPESMQKQILDIIRDTPGVLDVHALKSRQNGPSIILEAHIVVDPQLPLIEAHAISTDVEQRLCALYGAETQISIHLEPSEDAE